MAILIQAANISFSYGGNQLFTDLSFELKSNERLALVGENGSGKSSLFRLLARQDTPYKGAITHQRGLSIGYLEQDVRFDPEKTPLALIGEVVGTTASIQTRLAELEGLMASDLDDDALADVIDEYNVLLAKEETGPEGSRDDLILEILDGIGLPSAVWETAFGKLSGGEKKMVGLARFLTAEPDVLLLDEPDNHLDMRGKAWLERYLAAYPGAVGIITHDRYLIDRVATEIVELEDGKATTWPGNYSAFQSLKRSRLERAAEMRAIEEKELARLKVASEDLTQWARQNPKFASRAENMRRRYQVEKARLEATPAPRLERGSINVEFDVERGGSLVVVAEGISKSYGEREVVRPFDLVIHHGERVGIVGPNGAGKTTFVRMVLGQEVPSNGSLRIGASIKPGYYAQEHEALRGDQTPIDLVRKLAPLNEQQALSALVAFRFDRADAMNRIDALSGGERSRLQIASLILTGANFLVLDEPTNHLDIASTEALESALLDYEGTILTISHDRFYLDRMCTRVLEFKDGWVTSFPGGYTYYLENSDKGTVLSHKTAEPVLAGSGKRRR